MALFTIQRSYKQHQRYKFCSQKSSLTDIHKHTHRERETHSLPFCENANKANDWLIISPTCIYHYLVWSSLSISPSTLMPYPSFLILSKIFSLIFNSCQVHETLKPYQTLIIKNWLLQRAVQLKNVTVIIPEKVAQETNFTHINWVTREKATKKLKNCQLPQTIKSRVQRQWLVKGSKRKGKPLSRPVSQRAVSIRVSTEWPAGKMVLW